jgi:predicted DNA repair protein MutK
MPIEGCNLLAMLHDTGLVVADVSVVHSAAQAYAQNASRTNGVVGDTAAMAGVEISTVEFEG